MESVSYTVVDGFIGENAIFCTLSNVVLFHIYGFSGFINELIVVCFIFMASVAL